MGERADVAVEERLLRLGGVGVVERPPGVRQPHHEHVALHLRPGQRRVELTEVDLGLGAGQVGLRNRHLHPVQPQLPLAGGDVTGPHTQTAQHVCPC